ncbi:MAG: RelA/SpoT family protein, partial [Spirochaetota bacterium]
IRVILIKLADKLHNMRTLEYLPPKKRKRIARETLDIYAPLAGRLGMARIKTELEDLSLKYIEPEFYHDLKNYVVQRKEIREKYIERVKGILEQEFSRYGINARIFGRAKHFYSIHKKMKEKDKTFDEILDLFAIRIITDTVKECYEILGVVHRLWMPVRGRFKDYIAMPKSNMYQSLHTTVVGPRGKSLEVQIRTESMNLIAEEGIAAHWAYKEGKRKLAAVEKDLKWLKKLKNWKENINNPSGFMEDIQKDLLEDEIYVFTPKGDVIELPRGSTPIDFAYKIHTEVGHHCIGAKVNGQIVPLRKSLHSCEVVEILTSKNARPSYEWLEVVKTSRARHKIRAYVSSHDSMYALPRRVEEKQEKESTEKQNQEIRKNPQPATTKRGASQGSCSENNLVAEGEKNVQIHLAKCCSPRRGEEIIGYITRGKGITVHRTDCKNLRAIKDYKSRAIAVEWEPASAKTYQVDIISRDRPGLLMDISTAFANSNANITELYLKTDAEGRVKAQFKIHINDEEQLKLLLKDINCLPEVVSVEYR